MSSENPKTMPLTMPLELLHAKEVTPDNSAQLASKAIEEILEAHGCALDAIPSFVWERGTWQLITKVVVRKKTNG